jgi:hypothetical protein
MLNCFITPSMYTREKWMFTKYSIYSIYKMNGDDGVVSVQNGGGCI